MPSGTPSVEEAEIFPMVTPTLTPVTGSAGFLCTPVLAPQESRAEECTTLSLVGSFIGSLIGSNIVSFIGSFIGSITGTVAKANALAFPLPRVVGLAAGIIIRGDVASQCFCSMASVLL